MFCSWYWSRNDTQELVMFVFKREVNWVFISSVVEIPANPKLNPVANHPFDCSSCCLIQVSIIVDMLFWKSVVIVFLFSELSVQETTPSSLLAMPPPSYKKGQVPPLGSRPVWSLNDWVEEQLELALLEMFTIAVLVMSINDETAAFVSWEEKFPIYIKEWITKIT